MMFKRFVPALVTFAVLAGVFAGSALAGVECSTCQPWWHVISNARPTYLHPEPGATAGKPGQDEVEKLTVTNGKAGEIVLENANGTPTHFSYDAPASEVQERLEKKKDGETVFGAGNVEVTGGPKLNGAGETEGTEWSYLITFTGELAEKPVGITYSEGQSNNLFGFEGTAVLIQETAAKTGEPARPDGLVVASALNVGDARTSGEVRLLDHLPAGFTAVSAEVVDQEGVATFGRGKCKLEASSTPGASPTPVCVYAGAVNPYSVLEMRVGVLLEEPAAKLGGAINEVEISGGEAPSRTVRHPIPLSSEPVPFGVEDYELSLEEAGGAPDERAGSHPFQATFAMTMNQGPETFGGFGFPIVESAGLTKDVIDKLPPGLIGNPQAIPRCPLSEFLAPHAATCPGATVIGVSTVMVSEPTKVGLTMFSQPVFNLEPTKGEPARFGFYPNDRQTPVYIDSSVRTGGDYGINGEVHNVTQTIGLDTSVVTFWGVPGDARHDPIRGYPCLVEGRRQFSPCEPVSEHEPQPFFETPTTCAKNPLTGEPEPLRSSVEVDSWSEPGHFVSATTGEGVNPAMPSLDGCNRLGFEPTLEVKPDVPDASSSTGLTVNIKVPQAESLNASGVGEADIRDTTVALPSGVAINPSGGDGLEACSGDPNALSAGSGQLGNPDDQIGYTGSGVAPLRPGITAPAFTQYLPGSIQAREAIAANRVPASEGAFEPGVNFCSNASKIATVRIKTPLLEHQVEGAVYLADQEANPFGSLVAMYLVAEDPVSGSLLKLPGELQLCKGAGEVLDGVTCQGLGQIVTTFQNTPELPAEEIEFHFFGGERAPLATPTHCGSYTTTTSVTPWSAREPAEADEVVHPSSTFDITSGPNGGPCPGSSLPFKPSLTGGATNLQAGEFSPFTATFSRGDGEQNMQSIEAKLPPGLSGILTGVELCPEPQANEGACGPNSLIGETTVSVGVGSDPFTVSGGKFYLTGPYNGTGACRVGEPGCAPFGITFEVPAKAGPFDLAKTKANHPACDCVLVRGKIEVNPQTAALTVTSDPPGTPDAIPTSIEGIPLEIQHVNATTTRGNFQFNPTNCSKMEVTGTIHSSEGGTDTIGVPFQVTNCATLKFAPKFAVSTSAKTSRANGESLAVKLTYPSAPFGTQANIARVKVELPKQLPSRLTTLQKACTSAQFHANPAGCPADSIVGHAKAITPLVPVPLEGPAYFVSNGGEAFPNLIVVLQGYNVTIDLVGSTFINKAGVTSSTFKTVPDQPVGSFELTLPEGRYSALAAHGNLCKDKLTMPTEFIAQNGAEISQTTKIAVTGCAKHKKAKHRSRHGKRRKR